MKKSEIDEIENVVIISADSLRYKDFDNETAPFLKKMSREFTGHDMYFSNASWTCPAHASMFSRKLPSEHGTTTKNPVFEGDNKLVELFKDHGFDTTLITENGLLTPLMGFGEEFDFYYDLTNGSGDVWNEVWNNEDQFKSRVHKWSSFFKRSIRNRDYKSMRSFKRRMGDKFSLLGEDYNPTYTSKTKDKILEELEGEGRDFVFVNMMPVHYSCTFNESQKKDFLPNKTEKEIQDLIKRARFQDFIEDHPNLSDEEIDTIRNSYRASIAYLDSVMEKLTEEAPENTVFLFLGDHGEVIGEHGYEGSPLYEHFFGTYEELVHVPFVMWPYNMEFEGLLDHQLLYDILQSILEGDVTYEGKKSVISEHYGRKGFNDFSGYNIPEGLEDLYSRKSFSISSSDYKLDILEEGEQLWSRKNEDLSILNNEKKVKELKKEMPFVLSTIIDEELQS